ncbi:MAG: rhomboid family intramembrane serine protease [Rhizobiaceae bacterium]
MTEPQLAENPNPPAFNIPRVVLLLASAMVLVHLIRTQLLTSDQDFWVLNVFAFVPIFYQVDPTRLVQPLSIYWSPVTHGFLHGDWTHLIVNLVWLTAFGSAVSRRLRAGRFLVFMILATASGATAHFLFHQMGNSPVIGASGAVSACMGAAVRFAFAPGQPIEIAIRRPAVSLLQSLKNRSIMTFVVIWFAFNFLAGSGIIPLGVDGQIAWEAHMGGFLFGWLGFALLDPIARARNLPFE